MTSQPYLTTPVLSKDMPRGIPYIVGNEAAERFSFYGMRTILLVFMTEKLMGASGVKEVMNPEQANTVFHLFVMSAYLFPILGAIIADAWWGKYRTIMVLSVVYCLGHLALAIDETRMGLYAGLSLIAIGSGGIKPCVSAHVGDQFGSMNKHLMPKVFGWFYLAINLGAFLSGILTPILLRQFGPGIAFGIPGVLMLIATILFWMGRTKFIHVPPSGSRAVRSMILSEEGLQVLKNLALIFIPVSVFWSLFDQIGSSWVLQAKRLDLQIQNFTLLPSQISTVNPLFILMLVPLFSYVLYPLIDKVFPLTPLRKISLGMFLAATPFALLALVENEIRGGQIVAESSTMKSSSFHTFSASNVIDSTSTSPGWLSKPHIVKHEDGSTTDAPPEDKQPEIVIRLRERRSWNITELKINPAVNALASMNRKPGWLERLFGKKAQQNGTEADSRSCWAKRLAVSFSDFPNHSYVSNMELTLEQSDQLQSFTLSKPVTAQYVKLKVLENFGGNQVGLKQVQVLTDTVLPASESSSDLRSIWPNVADVGHKPHVGWQILAYLLLTMAEVMVSITCLEFAYTQAPLAMKSIVMSLFLLSISLGNAVAAGVNFFIQNPDGSSKMEGATYFWFFSILMVFAAICFAVIAAFYQGNTYIQGEGVADIPSDNPQDGFASE